MILIFQFFLYILSFYSIQPVYHRFDGPQVISVVPLPQSSTAENDAEIIVNFNTSIDPGSINNTSFVVFSRWSGTSSGNFVLTNDNTHVKFTPTTLFSAGERVTVTLSNQIVSQTTKDSLQTGYSWNFWINASGGSINFNKTGEISLRRSNETWIQTYGAYAGDLNRDGYSDFIAPNERTNELDNNRITIQDDEKGNLTVKERIFSLRENISRWKDEILTINQRIDRLTQDDEISMVKMLDLVGALKSAKQNYETSKKIFDSTEQKYNTVKEKFDNFQKEEREIREKQIILRKSKNELNNKVQYINGQIQQLNIENSDLQNTIKNKKDPIKI